MRGLDFATDYRVFFSGENPDLIIFEDFQKTYTKQIFLEVRQKKEGLGKAYVHGFRWALARNYENIFKTVL